MSLTKKSSSLKGSHFVVDTMALILFLEKRRLPVKVLSILEKAKTEETTIYIPVMVLAEIGYLAEKGRIDINLEEVERYLARYKHFKHYNITFKTIRTAFAITDIPELHDRIIAAVSTELGVPLLTNDPKIESSSFLETIWN